MRRILIFVTLLAASTVPRPAPGADEPRMTAEAIDIAAGNPIRLAERDIAAGRFRVLCVSMGWGCRMPGVGTRNYERCYSAAARAEATAFPEFGDVIGDEADVRARRRTVEFASKYNITVVRALDKLGKRGCPAGEDWDALVESVGRYLNKVVPGFAHVDISRDAADDDYFRIVTDYRAYVSPAVRSSLCDSAARHGVGKRVRIAVSDRPGGAPQATDRFQCEAGKLVD